MLYFFIQNASPRWDESGLRSGGCEMTILSSDVLGCPRNVLESSFSWRKRFRVSAEMLSLKFSWQAQYLVSLKGDFTCSEMMVHM